MSNVPLSAKPVDQTFRKKWNKAEYEAKAYDREINGGDDARPVRPVTYEQDRGTAQARDKSLALDVMVGKRVQVEDERKVGFYCEKCDRAEKDSSAWLDHLNSLQHQRAVGTSMRAEVASVDDVRDRLKQLKRKELERDAFVPEEQELDFEAKLAELNRTEEERRAERKAKRKAAKRARRQQERSGVVSDSVTVDDGRGIALSTTDDTASNDTTHVQNGTETTTVVLFLI